MKLKEDYAINKAKLLTVKNPTVQKNRISSMDNTQVNNQWIINQQNPQFQQGLQFRHGGTQVVYVPPQATTFPLPNQ